MEDTIKLMELIENNELIVVDDDGECQVGMVGYDFIHDKIIIKLN